VRLDRVVLDEHLRGDLRERQRPAEQAQHLLLALARPSTIASRSATGPLSASSERRPTPSRSLSRPLRIAIQNAKTWLSSGASWTHAAGQSHVSATHWAASVDLP